VKKKKVYSSYNTEETIAFEMHLGRADELASIQPSGEFLR
jgi:hypothetical protein